MTAYKGAQKWSKGICPTRESLGINMRVTTISGRWAIGYKDGHCTNMTTSCGDFSESGTWQPKIQSVQSVAVARTFSASVTFSPRHFSVSTDLLCRNSLVLKHQAEAFLHFETKRPALTFSDSGKTENRTSSCCVVWSSQPNQENHSNTQFRHSCYPLSPSATCPYPPAIARWVEQAKELLAGWRSSRTQQREHVPICPRPWMIKKKHKKTRLKDLSQEI